MARSWDAEPKHKNENHAILRRASNYVDSWQNN